MLELLTSISEGAWEYLWRIFVVILMCSGLVILPCVSLHETRKNVKGALISFSED